MKEIINQGTWNSWVFLLKLPDVSSYFILERNELKVAMLVDLSMIDAQYKIK